MTASERRKELERFHDKGISVLLMTFGAGGAGYASLIKLQLLSNTWLSINLTIANRIYILEPQWNPSTERQAIGRAPRPGQQNQVTVIRYVVKDTIEVVCFFL